MEYLYASEYAAFVSVDEDTAGDHLLDEVFFCLCCVGIHLLLRH